MQQLMVPKARKFLPLAAAFVAGALLVVLVCWLKGERWTPKPGAVLPGTELRLLGHIGPFEVYSKTDGTNEYAVFRGQKCLVSYLRAEANDTWETTHFEDGQSVLVTKTLESGAVVDRMFSVRDTSGQDIFSYVDINGDGQWDVMLDFVGCKKYLRRDQTWVPASSVKEAVSQSDGDKL